MKTMFLAAAAMPCIGTGVAYADGVEDAGWVPNTWFTEFPGTAPGMAQQRRLQCHPAGAAVDHLGNADQPCRTQRQPSS